MFQNAESVVKGVSPAVMRQVHCNKYRRLVTSVLLRETRKTESSCDMPECSLSKGHLRWLACAVCGRWFHTRCAGIPVTTTLVEGHEHECVFCVAAYR
jgi:hypothetical protein